MPWFAVDDSFPEHPKLEKLEQEPLTYMAAVTVWTLMGADCRRRLIDGVVTMQRLRKVLHHLGKHALIGAEALVKIELWERHVEGYRYHDWREYQPSKAEVKRARKLKTERQSRWRAGVDAREGASRDGGVGGGEGASGGAHVGGAVDGAVDASTDAPRASAVDASLARARPRAQSQPSPAQPRGEERERAAALALTAPVLELVRGAPAEHARLSELVRVRFEQLYLHERGSPPSWSHKNRQLCEVVARWLEATQGETGPTLERTLAGFFRDAWARSKGYPLMALANDPSRFLKAPEGGGSGGSGGRGPAPLPAASEYVPTDPRSVFGGEEPGE